MLHRLKKVVLLQRQKQGALAQLARALAWHARGHRFDSVMLHKKPPLKFRRCFFCHYRHTFCSLSTSKCNFSGFWLTSLCKLKSFHWTEGFACVFTIYLPKFFSGIRDFCEFGEKF